MKVHFPHPHPTFGRKTSPKAPSAWTSSVYYWWWEYLRRNEAYRKTCQHEGKGACMSLYKSFGNVHTDDFKTWWTSEDRGARLFAEPVTPSIQVLGDLSTHQQSNDTLLLAIPLNLPITHLVKRFREVLVQHHKGKRGVKVSDSTEAMFPVETGRIDTQFLQIALQVWDARNADPKMPWWEIATNLRLSPAHHILQSDTPKIAFDKKNNLSAAASRYYRKANSMIEHVGQGRFPVTG